MNKYFLCIILAVSSTLSAAEGDENNRQQGNVTPQPISEEQRLVDHQAREQEARDRARVERANQPVRRQGINDQERAIEALRMRNRQARLNQNLNFALPDEGFDE